MLSHISSEVNDPNGILSRFPTSSTFYVLRGGLVSARVGGVVDGVSINLVGGGYAGVEG